MRELHVSVNIALFTSRNAAIEACRSDALHAKRDHFGHAIEVVVAVNNTRTVHESGRRDHAIEALADRHTLIATADVEQCGFFESLQRERRVQDHEVVEHLTGEIELLAITDAAQKLVNDGRTDGNLFAVCQCLDIGAPAGHHDPCARINDEHVQPASSEQPV
ncbi:MAG TPA: hypothetical protein VF111_11815, partial [Thermoanaerobaculia bacterium]